MSSFFDDLEAAVNESPFDEIPVSVEQFVQSKDYLGLPPLSDLQYAMVKHMSQILRLETLIEAYGEREGKRRYAETSKEVILVLGKGSGKDYCTVIALCYVVYQLLCLKNPQEYYGKPDGDAIDLLNIAQNADQARNVFFKGFVTRIKRCPWFAGKFTPKNREVEFDKSITAFSGHSDAEAYEGLNLLFCVLDEISGFQTSSNTGNANAVTAKSTYEYYSDAVLSRFADNGVLAMLSFPRSKRDFILEKYEDVIAEKETIPFSHKFKIRNDLPDGIENNEFTIH